MEPTSSSPDFNMQRVDPDLLAPDSYVLGCQHGGVRRRLITIGLHFHATSHSSNGFTATGITQNVSLCTTTPQDDFSSDLVCSRIYG